MRKLVYYRRKLKLAMNVNIDPNKLPLGLRGMIAELKPYWMETKTERKSSKVGLLFKTNTGLQIEAVLSPTTLSNSANDYSKYLIEDLQAIRNK
jgi:hypothetical protein